MYLDNAATTPMEKSVIEAMYEVMTTHFGNPSSIHSKGRRSKTLIEAARRSVAEQLKCSTGEIFFTSSATESNNTAIFCAVRDLGVGTIISSPTEHPCVLNSLINVREHFGTHVEFVKVDHAGNIDKDHFQDLIHRRKGNTLVSIMHANNEIGTMSDIQWISEICAENEVLFHSDTVQTLGKKDLDLSKLPIGFLSGSGHKIFGPKGIGILYVNNDNMIKALIKGGGQERDIRSGTENIYGIVGFAEALNWLCSHREDFNKKVENLRAFFKKELIENIPEVTFNGNQDSFYVANILSTSLPLNERTELAMFNLDIEGICASAGSACSSGSERGSHVMEAIQSPRDRKSIRFSFSHHNTTDELSYTVQRLKEMIYN